MKLETPDDVLEYLHIDRDQIDTELVTHPALLFAVGSQWARAVSARDGHYQQLKALEAKVAAEYRKKPGKPTEKAVENVVMADPKVIRARDKRIELEHELNQWVSALDSVKQRGFALHDLAQLMCSEHAAVRGQSESRKVALEKAGAKTEQAMEQRRARRRVQVDIKRTKD